MCAALALSPATDILQRLSIDALFLARHGVLGPLFPPQASDVAVVVIDEETYRTPPFDARPRVAWTPHIAKVIEAVDAAGPRAIGYSLVDPTSLDQPDLLPRYDRPLLRAFAQAGRSGRLVLGELRLSGEMITPYRGQRIAVGGDDNVRLLNLIVDDDEVVRRQPRGFRNEGDGAERLTFAVELARRAGAALPQDDYLINFNTGPSHVPDYSLADMLACAEGNHGAFFARAFKDKVVLIGTALDVEDRRHAATWMLRARPDAAKQARCILPGDPERFGAVVDRRTVPAVFIHAAAINTLTKRVALRELSAPAQFASRPRRRCPSRCCSSRSRRCRAPRPAPPGSRCCWRGRSSPSSAARKAGGDLMRSQQMTEPDELAIGRDLYRPLIQQSGGAYANRAIQAALQRFAQPLFQTSARSTFQWEITVLEDDSVNAWALPAGKLAVNKGLLRYAASEHELAAVIAHEIGHAELSHHLQAMRQDNFTKAMTAAGRDVITAGLRGAGGSLTTAGIDALRTPMHGLIRTGYSREAEREADQHILTVFKRTGHDPAGGPAFFRTMLELVPPSSPGTTSLFSTHPGTEARIVELERASAGVPRIAGGNRTTASAFAVIKETFPTRRNFRRNVG